MKTGSPNLTKEKDFYSMDGREVPPSFPVDGSKEVSASVANPLYSLRHCQAQQSKDRQKTLVSLAPTLPRPPACGFTHFLPL